jgi:hypothetical protein
MDDAIRSDRLAQTEFRVAWDEGSVSVLEQDMEILPDTYGRPARLVGAIHDITERRDAEQRIRTLAYVDRVTGLPNRIQLEDYLRLALKTAKRHGRTLAVLFIDLVHFKRINDSWGHQAGDDVLREVESRLNGCLVKSECRTVISSLPREYSVGVRAPQRRGEPPLWTGARPVRAALPVAAPSRVVRGCGNGGACALEPPGLRGGRSRRLHSHR